MGLKDLSQVFPENSTYFYGYPLGWSLQSRFLNSAPATSEELVAAHTLVCAGANIDIVVFAKTVEDEVLQLLRDELGTQITQRRIIIPPEIHVELERNMRNEQIQLALINSVRNRALIMAQPYIHPDIEDKYLIDPKISTWANDKDNMRYFVPEEFMIPELGRAQSGMEFRNMDSHFFSYPCVIKLTASSGGDGVRICKSESEFRAAQEAFSLYDCPIIVIKFIDIMTEVGAKFAIYPDPTPRFARIGATKDFSNREGNWVGSLVSENVEGEIAEKIYDVLEKSILPVLHAKGWYGVGEAGALVDKNGRIYFSDFNCRVTGDMAQTFQSNQGIFRGRSLMVFNGLYPGTLRDFGNAVKSSAQRDSKAQILNVVAAAAYGDGVKIHGGVLFDQEESLPENIKHLEKLGIQSPLFKKLREADSY